MASEETFSSQQAMPTDHQTSDASGRSTQDDQLDSSNIKRTALDNQPDKQADQPSTTELHKSQIDHSAGSHTSVPIKLRTRHSRHSKYQPQTNQAKQSDRSSLPPVLRRRRSRLSTHEPESTVVHPSVHVEGNGDSFTSQPSSSVPQLSA